MKYKLDDLVKNYYSNRVYRDGLECHIRLVKLEGNNSKELEDIIKEKESYTKKVDLVENLFKEDGSVAPIKQHLTNTQYKVCDYLYIRNTKDRHYIARTLKISRGYVDVCVSHSMKKLRNIEINI